MVDQFNEWLVTLFYLKSPENQHGVHVDRAYASKYAASMEMAGFSITLMLLDNELAECLGNLLFYMFSHTNVVLAAKSVGSGFLLVMALTLQVSN